jgi:Fe-S-cluster-containing dehydrogenase component/formate-dependent nitrite reductase membrane component NrfD
MEQDLLTTMNYGFVIDNRKCIGCHACSTACKSENEVPLGVYRTWVKYVETGTYPDTRRHFQVTRCNHCANPPCVRICPTEAMFQRADGIVEFDNNVCIGCKACMQACPYDAIHIDPASSTAAKCNYCAHRIDIGLEPACVVVCPEQAIISGDINDPTTEISRLLSTQDVTVRKPDQGTAPKLFYIDGNDVVLHPTATERTPDTFMWADVMPLHGSNGHSSNDQQNGAYVPQTKARNARWAEGEANIRVPQSQGQPAAGPIQFGARVAEQMVQVAYNAQHKIPWHWPVPAYLVTKGIAAGIFMLLALGWGLNLFSYDGRTALIAGFLTLLFTAVTTGLLVYDLERPARFLYIIFRPQWKSWLARGAVLLIGFTIVTLIYWLFEIGANLYNYDSVVREILLWLGLPFAIGVAVYTAYLFAQAEGRDLWQSPLLPFHLIVQAILGGSAMLLIVNLFAPLPADIVTGVAIAFIVSLIVNLFLTLAGEFGVAHPSEIAARAAHEISHGRYSRKFWWGGIALGNILPLVLLLIAFFVIAPSTTAPILLAAAAAAAIAGLYFYEYVFVMAPQDIPNS